MTTEAENNDPRVADAYREMASERTPAALDRKILAAAAAAAETRGARGNWFKPLALAATVALSFALVLEITQVDDGMVTRVAAPEETAVKQKNEVRLQQELDERLSAAPSAAKATSAPARPESGALDAAVDRPSTDSASVASEFRQDNLDLLREAEQQMRMRAEPARAVGRVAEKNERSAGCGRDARASAEAWYECVKDMRGAGNMEAAQQELEALLHEYPDFREPPAQQEPASPTDR